LVENVLTRKEDSSSDDTHHTFQRMRIRKEYISQDDNFDKSDDDAIGYCVKRKLASSVYGSVYKGFVVKRRRNHTIMSTNQDTLDVIREDDELLDSKHSVSYDEDDCVWEPTNKSVIIKTASWERLRRLRGKHLEDPLKEIQALQLLGDYHPHLIHSLVALQDDKHLYSITPYCKDGSLYEVVMDGITSSSRLNENSTRHWFRQILLALHHLQQIGVCHRDISLENIVVHGKTCKLIDFGMALRVPYEHASNAGCVTDVSDGTTRLLMVPQGQGGDFTYMSPEVLNKDPHFDGFAIDLWAVGVILYIMLVGHKPFKWPHSSDEQFLRLAVDGTMKESLAYWEIQLSDDAIDLLQSMLWKDKKRRLTLAEVMEHPWVTSSDTSTKENDIITREKHSRKGSKRWSLRKTPS